jgi:DNA-binding response OmpR family regulator
MRRALVVEDDPDIVELLTLYLGREDWTVDATDNGHDALLKLREGRHQLVILDLQIRGLDGLSVCSELRRDPRTQAIPIVMLTARGDESDKIVGLELGADDYVVKPFSPKELLARVRAVVRRSSRPEPKSDSIRCGAFEIDRARHTASWRSQPVRLTAKEFELLTALIDAKGRTLSRNTLLENVWGYSYAEGSRTVDVHVRRLREKIPGIAAAIVTVKGYGYRFDREAIE